MARPTLPALSTNSAKPDAWGAMINAAINALSDRIDALTPTTTTTTPTTTTVTTRLPTAPLQPADSYSSAAYDTIAKVSAGLTVTADQPFTASIETSTDGATFATSGALMPSVLTSGVSSVAFTRTLAVAYTRVVILCGTTAMTTLTADLTLTGN